MAAARLVVILALASLLAIQAAETRPSFVEWISQGQKAKSASYYDTETESACLHEIALRNCKTCSEPAANTCSERYVESKVACCHHDSYDDSSDHLLSEVDSVGVCSYTKTFFDSGISYEGTATKKIGTFTATCELKDEADKCGSPLCEGMSLTVTGDILSYPQVAFIKHPEPTEKDEATCKDAPTESKKKAVKKAAVQDYKEYEGPKYWVGEAHIYSGTFYTISRHHKIPYKFGQFQLVNVLPDIKYLPEKDWSDKAYVAKPNAIALEFYKNEGY